jgi:3-oxoacyl-[acyl-carrier protein] reductase
VTLAGRRALVPAASSGIGHAVAERLASAGADVFITGVDEERLAAAAESTGAAGYVAADFTQPDQPEATAQAALDALGGIDILMYNTGGPPAGPFATLDDDKWAAAYGLILKSAVGLTRSVLPGMSERGWGRLIYLTSSGVVRPMPGLHLSNVMRAGVAALAASLAPEVAPAGVTTHVIAPAHIDTARRRHLAARRADAMGVAVADIDKRDLSNVPVGRFGTPEDIAGLVAFLASDEAGYMTGLVHAVDGGFTQVTPF